MRWLRVAGTAQMLLVAALLTTAPLRVAAGSPTVSVTVELPRGQVAVAAATDVTTAAALIPASIHVAVGELDVADYSPLVIVFVLDVSGSMSGGKLEAAQRAVLWVLDHLQPEDRISLLTFESTAHDIYSPPGAPDLDLARQHVRRLVTLGGTNMVDGLRLGMQRLGTLASPGAVQRIFLLGDGDANVGTGDMNRIAAWARDHDAAVSSFGVGEGFNAAVMQEIARSSGGNFYAVPDEGDLERIFQAELEEMQKNAGDQAQLVVKPTWGLSLERVLGDEAHLEAGPQVISLRSLAAGSQHTVQLLLRRGPATPSPGSPGRVDVSVSYLDEAAGDGRQAHGHADFTWVAAPAAALDPEKVTR